MEKLQNQMIATFIVEGVKKLPKNKNVDLLIDGLKDIINNLDAITQTEKREAINVLLEHKENKKF